MGEIQRIVDQVRRSFDGDAWLGASLGELLADVTAAEAVARPILDAHSIREIVDHLSGWQGAVRATLEGATLPEEPVEGDWPAMGGDGAGDWERARARLAEGHRRLREAVARLDDARLEEDVPGREYSLYHLIHGVVQHDLYHAGQIALLKKALRAGRAEQRSEG